MGCYEHWMILAGPVSSVVASGVLSEAAPGVSQRKQDPPGWQELQQVRANS